MHLGVSVGDLRSELLSMSIDQIYTEVHIRNHIVCCITEGRQKAELFTCYNIKPHPLPRILNGDPGQQFVLKGYVEIVVCGKILGIYH